MKKLILLFIFVSFNSLFAQLSGKVVDENNDPLADVNIYVEETFQGTVSTKDGYFELNIRGNLPQVNVLFQYMGYETKRLIIEVNQLPKEENIQLHPETFTLDDVVVNANENPAIRVIRKAIENRKANKAKLAAYQADFYSKGIWQLDNVPEKILGQEVGDFGGVLDSTRSGIIYLSETVSEIYYQEPNMKEHIIASKVSGNDNGFSWNNADDFNVSFYDRTIDFNAAMVSPIAPNAFSYYDYVLDGVDYDENKLLINKIQVNPKRPFDRSFSGYIYIVEDTGEIAGIDFKTNGRATQIEPLEEIRFQQQFTYLPSIESFVMNAQTIDFSWSIFGIKGDGKFYANYSNYNFEPNFAPKFFNREIISFADDANLKDEAYWEQMRSVPLTNIEIADYTKKDSIQELRKSKVYLDSIDAASNKFKVFDIVSGYRWKSTYKNREFIYDTPFPLGVNFNTVQGWNIPLSLTYRQRDEQNSFRKYWDFSTKFTYGFSEEKLRPEFIFRKKFNNFSKPYLILSAGERLEQLNSSEPITPLVNTVASVFWERSYIKLYERRFVEASYSQEVFNGFRGFATLGLEQRNHLFNATNSRLWVNNPEGFTSNNPLDPFDETSLSFMSHRLAKLRLGGSYNIGNKYITRPDGKYNYPNENYPRLSFQYIKTFASSITNHEFNHLRFRVNQEVNLKNYGTTYYSVNAGTFFGRRDDIAFVDFKHFNGNQTHVETSSTYVNSFQLLNYFEYSTTGNYSDWHWEHHFNGLVMNKVPLLNSLNSQLIVGAKSLFTEGRKPYSEVSVGLDRLGFGKFKLLRLDYVRSFAGNRSIGGFVVGIKILNIVN